MKGASRNDRTQIVVIGGGFAGVFSARRLMNHLDDLPSGFESTVAEREKVLETDTTTSEKCMT